MRTAGGGGRWRLSAAGWHVLTEDLIRVADVAAIAMAWLAVTAWRFDGEPIPDAILAGLFIGCLLAMNILPYMQVYRADRLRSPSSGVPRVILGWILSVVILIAVLFVMKSSGQISRVWLGAWFLAGIMALVGVRLVGSLLLKREGTARVLTRRIAIVGLRGGGVPTLITRLASADPTVQVVAVLDLDSSLSDRWPAGAAPLADFAQLEKLIAAGVIDQVLLAAPARSGAVLEPSLHALRHLPVDVSWAPEPPDLRLPVLGVAHIGDVPLVRLVQRPLDGRRYILKSLEDQLLAAAILVFAAPAMLIIALAVRLDSPGPVFFRQQRRGFSQEAIGLLKFRTMYVEQCDAADAGVVRQASEGDPRVTRLGRILRRTSLDELPQLLNVLRGEMSLVGPRPHAIAHDQYYADLIDDYLGRHRVKPGMTGWAQVNGYRGETRTVEQMRRRIELDLQYIDAWSLWLDVRILARTLLVGFRHPNAY